MAHSLKYIKSRIKSIESTKKVTNAMQMISAAKLSSTEETLFSHKTYFNRLDAMLVRFICTLGEGTGTFLERRTDAGVIVLCVITSDSGLCGTYNNNVIRAAEGFIASRGREKVRLVLVGKKAYNYFKKREYSVDSSYLDLHGRYSDKTADDIVNALIGMYVERGCDEVHLAYTYYESGLSSKPVVKKFLNLEPEVVTCARDEYITEPSRGKILEELVPRYIALRMRLVLLEAFASEHAARALAMKTATENAKELLEGLILLRNKVRQAHITQEILEIISASEALRV
ncbi:MAG: ATP synthase F1 subunit gamma [Candidatus Omnitrophota bacterium]